jgi:hypothetical protein
MTAPAKSIPKTISAPADPNPPSFLTTLQPEIRTCVYEVLFKNDEPVLVHNAAAYHTEAPTASEYHDYYELGEAVEDFDLAS